MYDVAGKLAVITGGTRGIGLEIAKQLLSSGARVVINGRNPTEEASALICTHGDKVTVDYGDVADPAYAAALIARSGQVAGRLDILVHAAGGPVAGTIMDLTPEA